MQDQELRELFDTWARPLRATPPPDIATLRRRAARRKTAWLATTAGTGLAVAGVLAGFLASGIIPSRPAAKAGHGGLPRSAAYAAPPGQPYVFVNSSATFANQGSGPTTPAELRNAATGKVVKVLRPVGQGASFANAAAAPGDRAFVLAQRNSDGTLSLAEIRISASGKPGPLRLIWRYPYVCVAVGPCVPSLTLPAGTQPENMSVNAAGTRVSFLAATPNGLGGSLVVYNLQTGTLIGRWPASNGIGFAQFLGTGDELVASVGGVDKGRDRLVDTSTAFRPGSSLLADSRPAQTDGFPGSFTQDGNVWMNTNYGQLGGAGVQPYGGPAATGNEVLIEYTARSGKPLRKFLIGPASALQGPHFCGVLWASANGGEMLTQCGTRQLEITGSHVTRVKLAWLLPSNTGFDTSTFAW
jgi:hypothetical protein